MKHSNLIIAGSREKKILLDVFTSEKEKQPVVIFCHGYKGFKDWGAWNLMGEEFAKSGFNLVKFNFSYNGITLDAPTDFNDLEAFGNNNYVTELNDLDNVITWLSENKEYKDVFDTTEIYLIGHSRGGGIVLLKQAEDDRVKKVVTWAGVSNYFNRVSVGDKMEEFKRTGVMFEKNGRTNQNMPIYYQFIESLTANKERLDIKEAVTKCKIPMLVVHGQDDPVVKFNEAKNLVKWNTQAELVVIENTAHTFDTKHPWVEEKLPQAFRVVLTETIKFF
jgi:pimeloyl-ACP methyl ester carboxylesterase